MEASEEVAATDKVEGVAAVATDRALQDTSREAVEALPEARTGTFRVTVTPRATGTALASARRVAAATALEDLKDLEDTSRALLEAALATALEALAAVTAAVATRGERAALRVQIQGNLSIKTSHRSELQVRAEKMA